MDERWPPYPAITSEHVRGARLFANRRGQIAGLPFDKGGRVAEVGVWRAAFSKVLVDLLKRDEPERDDRPTAVRRPDASAVL